LLYAIAVVIFIFGVIGILLYKNQQVMDDKSDADTKIILYNDATPVLEILPPDNKLVAGYKTEPIAINDVIQTSLGPLLQQAPNIISNGRDVIQNKIIIMFRPELTNGMKTGEMVIMKAKGRGNRLMVIDAISKKIRGHGKFEIIKKVNPAKVALGAFNIMAVVTAQQFLVDINQNLVLISKEVKDIKDWLKDERYGVILGNINYMETITQTLLSRGLNNHEITTFFGHLEAIERESVQILYAIEQGWDKPLKNVNSLMVPKIKIGNFDKELNKEIKNFEDISRSYLLCLYVRMVATKLLCALPTDRDLASRRLEDINTRMSNFEAIANNFEKCILDKIDSLDKADPKLNFRQTVLDRCQQLSQQFNYVKSQKRKIENDFRINCDSCKGQIKELSNPMYLEVEFDSDLKIKTIAKLNMEDSSDLASK